MGFSDLICKCGLDLKSTKPVNIVPCLLEPHDPYGECPNCGLAYPLIMNVNWSAYTKEGVLGEKGPDPCPQGPVKESESKVNCDLCNLEMKTTWYKMNDKWAIIECETCHVPMIVYRPHGQLPTLRDLVDLCDDLDKDMNLTTEIYDVIYTGRLRTEQRRIKDHWHIHLEKG